MQEICRKSWSNWTVRIRPSKILSVWRRACASGRMNRLLRSTTLYSSKRVAYAEIHDNKRKIVLMHYPVFCYNGQFRRGADGTPLTYMLHGHIHKTPDQELVDRFCTETRAMMRKSAHQEEAQPVPCQMINCFCMYSDYTPLTLEEWVECDQRRRAFLCAGSDY